MENSSKLFLPILLGTNRQGRQSEFAANFLLEKVQSHPDIETQLFDARDFDFPSDNYAGGITDKFPEYKEAIIKSDGIIIVTPEYNHGYPGPLKSMLDLLLPEYNHKVVGIAGVSSGVFGGTRVIEQLVGVVRELGLVVSSVDLNFGPVKNIFSDEGKLLDENFNKYTDEFFAELVWLGNALKFARNSA